MKTEKKKSKIRQVKTYCVNQGTSSQYFGLMMDNGKDKCVLRIAPNNWKTENGAINWARKQGYNVKTASGKKIKNSIRNSRKTKKKITKMINEMDKRKQGFNVKQGKKKITPQK